MADTDSSYIELAHLTRLAEFKRASDGLFDLSCEIDSLAQVASSDESSPYYHLGSLLLRFSGRLRDRVGQLQELAVKASS
ncbi:MAG: hypothetical protein ACK4OE_17910 [Acidovorax sp.]|uniref:hypothetical protein n=1 Tax=Acidovorax sp. TaxID=1872122 RepID=UPI0039199203